MKLAAEIVVIIVLFAVPLAIVAVVFVWGARRDGEEDRALQRRLGIRRRTRLGRRAKWKKARSRPSHASGRTPEPLTTTCRRSCAPTCRTWETRSRRRAPAGT